MKKKTIDSQSGVTRIEYCSQCAQHFKPIVCFKITSPFSIFLRDSLFVSNKDLPPLHLKMECHVTSLPDSHRNLGNWG